MYLSVAHDFLPKTNSTRASLVMDHFGIDFETGRHIIAEDLILPIQPGHVVLFTGASGSGKSSLMREAASQLTAHQSPLTLINIDDLDLGKRLLIDTLPGPVEESMQLLSACGLGEAHLMLRTPEELSDGQRYRFRLALALAQRPDWIIADEFTATLDRTLAKVIAFNIRRLADRAETGFLLATTHEDVTNDLNPEIHIQCRLDGDITVIAKDEGSTVIKDDFQRKKKRSISFTDNLHLTTATKSDWPYFARWHYRSHHIGLTKFVTLLWHGEEPIGICVFVSPPISLRLRNRFFGRSGRWNRTTLRAMNRQLVMLSRVVIRPTYRGAGIAAAFVCRSCELSGYAWVETLTQMGHINPFFEKAGFIKVGSSRPKHHSRFDHSTLYGGRRTHVSKTLVSQETSRKSRYAKPVYYIFDNRDNVRQSQHVPQVSAQKTIDQENA